MDPDKPATHEKPKKKVAARRCRGSTTTSIRIAKKTKTRKKINKSVHLKNKVDPSPVEIKTKANESPSETADGEKDLKSHFLQQSAMPSTSTYYPEPPPLPPKVPHKILKNLVYIFFKIGVYH